MTVRLPALAGRAVCHAAAPEPWPERRPMCDRMLARVRVRLVPCNRRVTCRRCLRVLAALRKATP